MKRTGPPKRKTELARGDKPLKRKTSLDRGVVLARKAPKEPAEPRYAPVPGGPETREPLSRVRFRAVEPARTHVCARCAQDGRSRQAQCYHHWLPQQQIRVYVRGLRLPPDDARRLLASLLRDKRNLAPLCHRCHDDHEGGRRRFSGEDVPHSARVFALRLGTEWLERLRRMYPGGGHWVATG